MTDWQTGLLAFREGRLREAADRLGKAASDRDRTVSQIARFQTYAFLGAALYALGRAAEAVPAFEAAVRLSPAAAPADLTFNLANAYLAAGRRADSQRMLETTLQNAPGHIEARLLLERLAGTPADAPVTGSVLGESPEAAQRFLRTLTFGTVSHGGYAPDQVRGALSQIERYINVLAAQLADRDQTIIQQAVQIEQARDNENTLIDNLVQARQDLDRMRNAAMTTLGHTPGSPSEMEPEPDLSSRPMTPLEKLFQKKT